jgi:hypothetical protein
MSYGTTHKNRINSIFVVRHLGSVGSNKFMLYGTNSLIYVELCKKTLERDKNETDQLILKMNIFILTSQISVTKTFS